MTAEKWNPVYYDKYEVFYDYEKRWYCNENKVIHGSEKEKNSCKYCKEL